MTEAELRAYFEAFTGNASWAVTKRWRGGFHQ